MTTVVLAHEQRESLKSWKRPKTSTHRESQLSSNCRPSAKRAFLACAYSTLNSITVALMAHVDRLAERGARTKAQAATR